jgi:hypothetical protein
MGMYVCVPHQQQYNLSEGMRGTNLAICEICGYVDGDWDAKTPVIFTPALARPILVNDTKRYVLDQLAGLPGKE